VDSTGPKIISEISIPPPDLTHLYHLSWLNNTWIMFGIHGTGFLVNLHTKELVFLGHIPPHYMDGSNNRYLLAEKTKHEIRIDSVMGGERIVSEFLVTLHDFVGILESNRDMVFSSPRGQITVEGDRLVVAANPLGTQFAIALDHYIEIRNSTNLELLHTLDLRYWIEDIRYSSTGEYLVIEYSDNTIEIFDTLAWKNVFDIELLGSLEMYADRPYVMISERPKEYSLDDLALERYSKGLVVTNIDTMEEIDTETTIKSPGEALGFLRSSPDGRFLAVELLNIRSKRLPDGYEISTSDGKISLWQLPDFDYAIDLYGNTNPDFFSKSINPLRAEFSPDSKYIAIMFNNQNLTIWELPTHSFTHSDFKKASQNQTFDQNICLIRQQLIGSVENSEGLKIEFDSLNTKLDALSSTASSNQHQLLRILQLILKIDYEDKENREDQIDRIRNIVTDLATHPSKRQKILDGLSFVSDSYSILQLIFNILGLNIS